MGRIIGIDLGTTTSEIAYIKNNKPEVIINDLGERKTPSVVHLDSSGDFIVGKHAKSKAALNPNTTVMEVKRLIGTDQKVKLGNKEYLPEEISSIILKKLKKYAEDYLCEEVTEAVITVPANFNEFQRRATQRAGELAGLKVERIINEPTAAALAYGIDNLQNDEKVLVYDIGGGTFDVTVLELFNGVLDVKASRGNNRLGGKDFDERIEKYLINDFKQKHGIDLSDNQMCLSRIKEVAEKAKIELSNLSEAEIILPFIAMDNDKKPLTLNVKLTRDKYDELISDLINSTKKNIDDALKASEYTYDDIDVVLAVGGSSRNICIKNLLSSLFGNKVKTVLNPDEAVTLGAAVEAGLKNNEIDSNYSMVLADVCSYSLGTEVRGDIFDVIIKRDTKIPCSEIKYYNTMYDNQDEIMVGVYQGEGSFVVENNKIGELLVTGVPLAPAGQEGIDVEYTYNLNGILDVYATIVSTGKVFSLKIDMSKMEVINSNNNVVNNETLIESYNEMNTVNETGNSLKLEALVKGTIQLAENKLNSVKLEDAEKIKKLIKELKKAVLANNEKLLKEIDDELTDLLFDLV